LLDVASDSDSDVCAVRYLGGVRILLVAALLAACEGPPTATTPKPVASALASIEASNDLDGGVIGASEARATVVVVFASWCEHCHHELEILAQLRPAHAAMRVLGVNYRGHEEYDNRGNSIAVRQYVAAHAPWMRVVPADDALFGELGSPPKIPTIFIYDRAGNLVTTFDRRERPEPEPGELEAVLRKLGA
jgi:thiol-disulfide isomerase/thioredoxin